MGEPMLTKEQAEKLDELIHNVVRITAQCAANPYPGTATRLGLIKADKELTEYLKEITVE